jgi:phytanoyl-CoA hydroxylase
MSRNQDANQMKSDFDRDGYIAKRSFLDADEWQEMHQNLSRFIEEVVPAIPREHVYYESLGSKETIKQIQRLNEYDPYFDRWLTNSKFRHTAEILLGEEVSCQGIQYFNKSPNVGLPTPPHQDGYYFMLEPCEAVTMWLALEEVDEENGCVRYVPGSHRLGMRDHGRTDTLGFSKSIVDYPCSNDRDREIASAVSPGDLLAHHALTVHRADGNRSATRTRQALGFLYYAASAKPDKKAHAEYQKQLKEELACAGKI